MAGQGEVPKTSPASPCFRWLISGVTSEQQFTAEAQRLENLRIPDLRIYEFKFPNPAIVSSKSGFVSAVNRF